MRLQTFAILVFSACLIEYLMGFNTAFDNMYSATQLVPTLTNPTAFIQLLANNMASLAVWGGLLAIVAAISIFTGFSAVFVIPLLILLVVVNWFVFPQQMLGPVCLSGATAGPLASCPNPSIFMPIVIFLNVAAILTYIEFVRGPS